MKTISSVLIVLLVAVLTAPQTNADQDPIPVTGLAFGETLDLFFPNTVRPTPSRKVLQFVGEAESFGLPGTAAILGIHFDYVDAAGNTVIVPLPNFYQEAIPTGAGLIPISAGPYILDFCPEVVSIHFENLTEGTEILFQGIFDHTCVAIPEPSTSLLVLIGCSALLSSYRRR